MAPMDSELTPLSGRKGGAADEVPPPPPVEPDQAPGAYMPPVPPEDETAERARRGGGQTAGIVLIVIGLVFLVGQMVPGLAWWSMWPLIIVIAGLVHSFTPGREGWSVARLFDGFVTVTIGLVFLAITLGYVSWSVFWTILGLWPVLLIAIGLDVLGKALHTSWVRALGSLCVIAALVYAVSISATGATAATPFWQGANSQAAEASIDEPVSGITRANLKVDAGAAKVTLDGGSALVEAEGSSPWGEPQFSVERSGTSADVLLNLGEGTGTVVLPNVNEARLDASVARDVVWDMDISTGVSQLDADLSDVPVRALALKPGVAGCTLRMGDVPEGTKEASLEVKAGVSTVHIRLPKDAQARIESDSGLTAHSMSDDFRDVGDNVWQTEGFESAQSSGDGVWLVSVKSGVGSIDIDTY